MLLHDVLRPMLRHDLRPVLHDLVQHVHHRLQHLLPAGVKLLLLEQLRLHGGVVARHLLRAGAGLDGRGVVRRHRGGGDSGAGAGEASFHFGGCAVTIPAARALHPGSVAFRSRAGIPSSRGSFFRGPGISAAT
jgi:hypothetical protein